MRKKRRSNDLARILSMEDCSDDEMSVGLSKSKKAKLVVNLYSEEQGYSFGYHVTDSTDFSEFHAIPYCERYLLDSIDQEQIPHKMLCKFEDREGVSLMRYRNQVVAEIRDYRKSTQRRSSVPNGGANGDLRENGEPNPGITQVMLQPTTESFLCDFDMVVERSYQDRGSWAAVLRQGHAAGDVSHLAKDGSDSEFEYEVDVGASQKSPCNNLTYDQRLELERQFVNAIGGPLCLDPSPDVNLISNRLQFEKLKWNTEEMKTAGRRWEDNPFKNHNILVKPPEQSLSAPSLAEGRMDIEPFYNFVMGVRQKRELNQRTFGHENDKDALKLHPIIYQDYPDIEPPKHLDEILRIGQPPEAAQLRIFPNENFVRKIEEYTLETERRKRPHTTTLSIFQRNGMESYFGELEMESFLDPSYPRIGSLPSSTKCQFELGSSRNVTLYVKQFSDIFTEDGRRPCKITYQKMGQPPQVVYTNSYKSATPIPLAGSGASAQTTTSTVSASISTSTYLNSSSQNTVTAVTASIPQVITASSSPVTSSSSQVAQSVSVSAPHSQVVTVQQTISRPQTPSTPVSTTAPSLPPVQIVHPQPRTNPQSQVHPQAQPQTQQASLVTGQQRQIQIYSSQPPSTLAQTTVTSSSIQAPSQGANVNLNVNLHSGSGLTPQQVLTRPHILTSNQAAQQQLLHLTQQRILRMKQQQPNTALAKLLLTNLQGTKPITVAVQPIPQTPVTVTTSTSVASPVCSSSSSNPNPSTSPAATGSNSTAVPSPVDPPAAQQNPLGSPLMIQSPSSVSGSVTNSSPNLSVNVNTTPNVNVNLNTISLDGLLAASTSNLNFGNTTTLTTNAPLSGSVLASNVNLGLSRITTSTGQPTVNILRLNNNSGTTVTSGTGGNSVQLAAVHRQLAMSNALSGNVSILQQSPVQAPQQRILINANNLNSLQPGELDELSVPDLTTLLGGQPIQISQLGQQQILNQGAPTATSQTTIDTTNLNLNLNVNLNSGTVVNNAEVGTQQIGKIQGGEWTTTAQAPPFLVFISPLRPMSIAPTGGGQRQITTTSIANPNMSVNLGQQPQGTQIVTQSQTQSGKSQEGPTRILLGSCNNGVAIKREVASTTVAATTSSSNTMNTMTTAGLSQDLPQMMDTSSTEDNHMLEGDVVVDGVDSLFHALSEAIGPEQLQKLDAMGGTLSQSGAATTVPIPSSTANFESLRILSAGTSSSLLTIPSSSVTSTTPGLATQLTLSNNTQPKVKSSSNVITLSDLLGTPTVVSSSTSGSSASFPLILSSVSGPSPVVQNSPTLSSLLNTGPPTSSAQSSSIVSSTPRLSALLAGTPSADTVLIGNTVSQGMNTLLSPSTPDSSSTSYGNLLDRLAASLNQPQGPQGVRSGASRLNPIATATPSVVLEHPVLAATLTQQQGAQSVGGNVNRMQSGFRQIAPAPSGPTGSVAVISDSHLQSPQLINLLGLVGNNSGGQDNPGQTRTIRISGNSTANNTSPGSAAK